MREINIYTTSQKLIELLKIIEPLPDFEHKFYLFNGKINSSAMNLIITEKIPEKILSAKYILCTKSPYLINKKILSKIYDLWPLPLTESLIRFHFKNLQLRIKYEFENTSENIEHQKRILEMARQDYLTGLATRWYLQDFIERNRHEKNITCIYFDLDNFKSLNDTFGHLAGDRALAATAEMIQNEFPEGFAARMGGEEFNVLLPGISSEGAMIAAERIRKAIETTELDTIGNITGSLGVATYFEHTENVDELLELTDQAMYTSKRNGRNRVTLAKPVSETMWQEVAVNTFIDILSKNRIPKAQHLSKELCLKLKAPVNKDEMSQDSLYTVADMLTKLYNPMHTDGIIKRKVLMSVSLAKRFDLPKEEIDKLKIAILLYDIGNLMLPEELLQKATPLTDEERNKIKNHPLIAARDILKPISCVQDLLPIIEYHHENWDGTGYPAKIAQNEIPLPSQIILIVDEYFALIEQRPYRAKLSSQDALKIIKADSGTKWNEALAKEFISLIEHDIV